jgi:hypothetical protein
MQFALKALTVLECFFLNHNQGILGVKKNKYHVLKMYDKN